MFTGDLEREGEEAMAAYYDGSTKEKHYLKLIYLKQVIMDQKLLQMNAYFL